MSSKTSSSGLARGGIMRKWVPLLIITAALVASAIVYPDLPERVPTHWNFKGEVDGWSTRAWGAWMMPVMIAFIWALMRLLPSIDPRGRNYIKFGGTFEGIMLSVMLFLLALHGIMLAVALGYPVAMDRAVPAGVGILLIVIGNLLPRARPNWFVGIRTPWTLSSDRVWEKSHRVGGRIFVLGGILIAVSPFFGAEWNHWVPIAVVGVCSLAVVVYSYVAWRKEKTATIAFLFFALSLCASVASAAPVASISGDTIAHAPIDTTAPATVLESPYEFTSESLSLPGTLTLPRNVGGKIPVALI